MTSTAPLRNERSWLEIVAADGARATRRNRRIIVPRYGGPDVMTVIEEPLPEPGPGQVRVRIWVAGVGYPDVLIREGTYPGGPKPPFTPGYEFIGTVDKLGAGVEGFELGQRVGAISVYGSHADYLCVPAWWLVPVPHGLDPAEAAIVVFNYVTTYQMLYRTARVKEGERLLVHGAAGLEDYAPNDLAHRSTDMRHRGVAGRRSDEPHRRAVLHRVQWPGRRICVRRVGIIRSQSSMRRPAFAVPAISGRMVKDLHRGGGVNLPSWMSNSAKL
jgi:alcohol dehydrogenase-like protein